MTAPPAAPALSGGDPDAARRECEVSTLCARINDELSALLQTFDRAAKANDSCRDDLGALRRALPAENRAKDLRAMTDRLIEISRRQTAESETLRRNLSAARDQVSTMRAGMDALRRSARRDHLTGLGNRRLLEEELAARLADRRVAGDTLCFALADIDHFKRVNDRFGHPAGDAVLKKFAELIGRNIKGKDLAARYGGEEFALVLEGAELRGARRVLEQIRQALGATRLVTIGTREPIGRVTASFGLTAARPGDDVASLVARADRLLYEAKAAGRDMVRSEA